MKVLALTLDTAIVAGLVAAAVADTVYILTLIAQLLP
jgi:hypothetical protein